MSLTKTVKVPHALVDCKYHSVDLKCFHRAKVSLQDILQLVHTMSLYTNFFCPALHVRELCKYTVSIQN